MKTRLTNFLLHNLPRLWLVSPIFFCLPLLLSLSACGHFQSAPRPPSATISTPGASVTQSGDARTPAHAETETTTSEVPLPAFTEIRLDKTGKEFSLALPAITTLRTTTRTERIAAPASFDPPAPPTPAAEAQGFGVRAFWVGALLCLLGAGVLAWAGHPLAAVCAAGAGIALPILANFFSSAHALTVAGCLLGLGGGLFLAWHILAPKYGLHLPAALTPKP